MKIYIACRKGGRGNQMPFEIVRNDIVKMKVDAIVNAANSSLAAGGGVCGAIFAAAGQRELSDACRAIGHCAVGNAVITAGFRLPAKYVIHAVGPIWRGGRQGEPEALRSCYLNSLALAEKSRCASIAFPLISAGIYGYPADEALRIAVSAIGEYLSSSEGDMQVYLVLYDRKVMTVSQKLFAEIQSFVDDNYVDAHADFSRMRSDGAAMMRQMREVSSCMEDAFCMEMEDASAVDAAPQMFMEERLAAAPIPEPCGQTCAARSLEDMLGDLDDSFTARLLHLIDERKMEDVEVYKRANIDRKLFSKIRKGNGYNPSKPTALALAVALRLDLEETRGLLSCAGYALSRSSKSDVIIEYFIREKNYDIFEINEALFAFQQHPLGA